MRDHEERAVEAVYCAEPCPLEPSCDEATVARRCRTCRANERIVVRVAAALRSAEESAARRCAEIAREIGQRKGRATGAQVLSGMIRAAIWSEFGLGEEAGDE